MCAKKQNKPETNKRIKWISLFTHWTLEVCYVISDSISRKNAVFDTRILKKSSHEII